MGKNFYISDLHFDHANIIKLDNRPFYDVDEMNEELIKRWNSVVSNDDTVYILGDFCWSKKDKWNHVLEVLKGNKVLIRGNHDVERMPKNCLKYFSDVKNYLEINDGGKRVIMCHYPILTYRNSYDFNTFMLFGHVHLTKEWEYVNMFIKEIRRNVISSFDNKGQLIHVGCMMPWMNYTPQTLEALIKVLDSGGMY